MGGTWIGPDDERLQTTCQRYANKLIWAIGAFRNSFVVIMCALISYCYVRGTDHDTESDRQPPIPFKIIGEYSDEKNRRFFFLTRPKIRKFYVLTCIYMFLGWTFAQYFFKTDTTERITCSTNAFYPNIEVTNYATSSNRIMKTIN